MSKPKKSSPRSVTDAKALQMANDTVTDFLSGKRELTSSIGLSRSLTRQSKKGVQSSKSAPAVSKDSGSGEEKNTPSAAASMREKEGIASKRYNLSWRPPSKLKPKWQTLHEKQHALQEQMYHRDKMTPAQLMLKRTPKYHASLSSRFPSTSSLPYPKKRGGRKTKRKRRRKHKLRTKKRKLHKKTRRKHRRKSYKKRKSKKR